MKNKRLMMKYVLRYTAIFVIVMGLCTPILLGSYDLAEDSVISQSDARLKEGTLGFGEQITKLHTMAMIIRQDRYLSELTKVEEELPTYKYVNMNYISEQLSNLNLMHGFSAFSFILFKNNEIFVSNSQVDVNFRKYYGQFLRFGDYRAEEFRELLFGDQKALNIIPVKGVSFYNYYIKEEQEDMLLCVVKAYGGTMKLDTAAAIAFLIPQDTVVDLFLNDEMQEAGFLRLYDDSGEALMNYGIEQEAVIAEGLSDYQRGGMNYRILTASYPTYGLTALIGVPEKMIKSRVEGIMRLFYLYLMIGVIVLAAVVIYYCYRQYVPVRNILKILPDGQNGTGRVNEYDFIQNSVQNVIASNDAYKERLELLETQMKISILEKSFLYGVYTEDARREFERSIQVPIEFFCVVLLHACSDDPRVCTEISVRAGDILRRKNCGQYLTVHSGISEDLYLFLLKPQDSPDVTRFKSLFEELISELNAAFQVTLNAGISAVGQDISNIHICYNQARQAELAYYMENANSVGIYSQMKKTERNPINFEFMQKLGSLIMCGEKKLVADSFGYMIRVMKKNPMQYEMQRQQIFYAARYCLMCACQELSIPAGEEAFPAYHGELSTEQLMEELKNSAMAVCEMLEENKKSKNVKLKDSILNYLQENYTKPELTAVLVCEQMGISEKYLFQFMKEQTGKTLLAYLEELRLARAEELLKTTDWNNARIAEESGFGSVNTLYRIFNKYVGVSPGAYRENLKI